LTGQKGPKNFVRFNIKSEIFIAKQENFPSPTTTPPPQKKNVNISDFMKTKPGDTRESAHQRRHSKNVFLISITFPNFTVFQNKETQKIHLA
jgi:hypothetical protein